MTAPAAFQSWLERWFSPEEVRAIIEAGEPWSVPELTALMWALADTAGREVAARVLEAKGATELAALHRALRPVGDSDSARWAMYQLYASMQRSPEFGINPHFFGSSRRVVEFAMEGAADLSAGRGTDTFAVQTLFGDSGALDMSLHRGVGSGAKWETLLDAYRRVLLKQK